MLPEVSIFKLVYGGQGIGELPDGRKVFVWNALPDEKVCVRVIKQKHSYAEAITEEVIMPSIDRVVPSETNYMSTSPWQIMNFEAENRYKKDLVRDVWRQHKLDLPAAFDLSYDDCIWQYRNKMEYSFWGDDHGLRLALHDRGTHRKQIVHGSKLAMTSIDEVANKFCALLSECNVRASSLKTIVVRSTQDNDVALSLFVKTSDFPDIKLVPGLKGVRVYYSNSKSPASVSTRLLCQLGDCSLKDTLLGKDFIYDVDSFFQVNVPVFELALQRIKEYCNVDDLVDMYAGVGSIGLSIDLE